MGRDFHFCGASILSFLSYSLLNFFIFSLFTIFQSLPVHFLKPLKVHSQVHVLRIKNSTRKMKKKMEAVHCWQFLQLCVFLWVLRAYLLCLRWAMLHVCWAAKSRRHSSVRRFHTAMVAKAATCPRMLFTPLWLSPTSSVRPTVSSSPVSIVVLLTHELLYGSHHQINTWSSPNHCPASD